MFVRRLIVLFTLIAISGLILTARLAQLQLLEAQSWQDKAETFINRHYVIETSRGSILDRAGRPLAIDKACYDLAIDYRAMNMDDQWITAQAKARLTAMGIKGKDRLTHLAQVKADIAAQVDSIPDAIAHWTGVSADEILQREDDIRRRMDALRQTQWVARRYDKAQDAIDIAQGLIDPGLDVELKEESVAHTIVPAVPNDLKFEIDKVIDQYPGLKFIDSKRREYPYGPVAAHVIGAQRPVTADEYTANRFDRPDLISDEPGNLHGYLVGDDIGAFGLERLGENTLRGTRGVRLVEVGGQEIIAKRQPAAPGANIQSTLDIELQRMLTAAILNPTGTLRQGQDNQDHNVALVVMSVNPAADGQILAMLSTPTYDLNSYRTDVKKLIQNTTDRPLLNRAAQGAYPPGSIVKPLVATAALTEAVVTPTETINCIGYLYPGQPNVLRCDGIHGPMSMESAIERSCNVYFYTMGGRLGLDRLVHWYQQFGLGAKTGLDLPEESRGSLPNLLDYHDANTAARESIQLGIGQGSMTVTPLQMACAYAALLRGGKRISPTLLLGHQGTAAPPFAVPADAYTVVRHGMELVVNGDSGTARSILRMKVGVAGKTGTAETPRMVTRPDGTPDHQWDAWFVGYVPADNPQFVIAAVKESGGHGGTSAAPLVKEAILDLERLGYLPQPDLK